MFFRMNEHSEGLTMDQPAFNPYLPSHEYVPDGEPRVFGDRLYVYGSHDLFGGTDFCLGDYVLWSAPLDNLGKWRCEGIIYRKEQDPKNRKGKMHMCAPDCVKGGDGRYYLYYQLHALTCTSVAVADSPTGPFEFYGYVQHPDGTPWGMKKGDSFAFDPGVLVDDNGQAYLYVGFSPVGLFKTVFKLRGNRVDQAVCLMLEPVKIQSDFPRNSDVKHSICINLHNTKSMRNFTKISIYIRAHMFPCITCIQSRL